VLVVSTRRLRNLHPRLQCLRMSAAAWRGSGGEEGGEGGGRGGGEGEGLGKEGTKEGRKEGTPG
jgi:hypothetical protein